MNDLLDLLVQLAGVILIALGTPLAGWIAVHLATWLKLQSDAQVRSYLLAALDRAVEYGQAEARRRIRVSPASDMPALPNAAAELARDYAQRNVAGALRHFGIDTSQLDQLIRARMPRPASWPAAGA